MKPLWKTFIVDLLVLFLIFWLFVFTKGYVGNFLEEINNVDLDIDEVESELDNQTTEQLENFVENYSFSIWWFYLFMIFIIPLILFIFVLGSQNLNIAFVKKSYKMFWLYLIYALPILLIFYISVSYFIENFYLVLNDVKVLFVLGLLLLLLFIMSYVWFGILCGDYKKFLKKFYLFMPLYILFIILFTLSLIITLYLAALYLVDGLLMLELFRYFILICVLLTCIQYLRKFIVDKMN